MMKNNLLIKITVSILVLLTITVNALANILPINGVTTAELSDAIPIFFVPAGYVFSIWGIIYIGLIIYAGYLFKKFDQEDVKIFPWFVLSSIANMTWILLWHYQLVSLSVIVMLLLLASLIAIYLITDTKSYSKIKRATFQIYLGWVSVATVANIAGALYLAKWDGFGLSQELWSVIMIGIATNLAIMTTSLRKDLLYSLVIIWAVVGILFNFFESSDLVTGASLVSIMAILMNIFVSKYCKRNQ